MALLALLLAQQSPTIPGLDVLGGTVLGVVVLLLVFGWLWAKPAVDDIRRENARLNEVLDRKDIELAHLRESFDERVIPVIEKNTHIADRVLELLEKRDFEKRVQERLEGGR